MLLIGRNPVPQDFIAACSMMVFSAAITGVTFDVVDNAGFNTLDDTSMIGFSVLQVGASLVYPIEKDNRTGCQLDIVICPLTTFLEPVDTIGAARVFWLPYSWSTTIPYWLNDRFRQKFSVCSFEVRRPGKANCHCRRTAATPGSTTICPCQGTSWCLTGSRLRCA